MIEPFLPIPYREHEPIEKIWVEPCTEEQIHRSRQAGESIYRYPPDVESRNSSVYQAWSPLAAGEKGGLWVGTWGLGIHSDRPGLIWRMFSDEECNMPPPSNIISIQKSIEAVQ